MNFLTVRSYLTSTLPLKSFLLLLLIFMAAKPVAAQQPILQKPLSLSLGTITLAEALSAIEKKTGCEFIYSPSLFDTGRKVSLNYTETPLSVILQDILESNARSITVSGNQIKIQPGKGKGTVTGSVVTSDGKPAAFVTIGIKGQGRTQTDGNGDFKLTGIDAGSHTLTANHVGLQTRQEVITVAANQTVVHHFTLKEDGNTLNEVAIRSRSGNKMAAQESEDIAKMPLKTLENPQVYSVVPKEILRQQAITSYDDALKNVPGIQRLWESTGRGGDGGSYFSLRGFEAQVSMLNGLPGLTMGNLDPANIEKIEVIKGPSGTLFGGSVIGYGGIINNVTKKPYHTFGGEVSYTTGNFGLNRVTGDFNIPLDKEEKVALRINTAYQNEGSFQDQGFRKSFFFAPTLAYKVNDQLSFLFVTEFMQEERTNPTMLFLGRNFPLKYKNLEDLNYNNKLSLTSNDLSISNPRYNLQGQMNYKLSESWTSQTVISRSQSNSDGYTTNLYDRDNGRRDFELVVSKENSLGISTDIQQNFIGDFNIGNFRNRIVAGLDYFENSTTYQSINRVWIHNVTPQGEVNYISPKTGEEVAPVYLTRQSVDKAMANTDFGIFTAKTNTYSAYASDVFSVTSNLNVMTSLRVDYYANEEYKQTAFSPKFGIIYEPIKDQISVFGNYMNGFKNIAPAEVADENGENPSIKNFKPEHANQLEFGFKTNLFTDRLTSTVSYYDIKVEDQVLPDPNNVYNSLQGGKSKSKGIEVDLNANPVNGLNIILGYAYNESRIVKGGGIDDVFAEEGIRPIWAGPAHLFNAWATYSIGSGLAKGLGLGFGGNYASDNTTLNNTLTGRFVIPSYTILNGALFYDTEKFRLGFNLSNLTNKEYYGGAWSTINPQKPRSFVANFTYKF